jgi:hypothetical protein
MGTNPSEETIIRVFRGDNADQFEAYIQFFDDEGLPLNTKGFSQQNSVVTSDGFPEDRQTLDLDSFWYYEGENVHRIECHSDLKEICLSPKLRPKVGTIEFLDERRKDLIKRGRFSFIEEADIVTQYDISEFFSKMNWVKPDCPNRKPKLDLFSATEFPILIESHFKDQNYSASIRFFDFVSNSLNLSDYETVRECKLDDCMERWTTIDLPRFLKEKWSEVHVVEARSDLTAIDRFKHIKGNIDYLIYCKASNYKKLPEYLYKRIQTRKLDDFLKDIQVGLG